MLSDVASSHVRCTCRPEWAVLIAPNMLMRYAPWLMAVRSRRNLPFIASRTVE